MALINKSRRTPRDEWLRDHRECGEKAIFKGQTSHYAGTYW